MADFGNFRVEFNDYFLSVENFVIFPTIVLIGNITNFAAKHALKILLRNILPLCSSSLGQIPTKVFFD